MNRLLLIVDPQIDFITGTLPVPNAQEKMSALADFIKAHDGDYALKVITTDFHPFFHCSFKAQGGPWPQHCVQDSVGAAIFQPLLEAVYLTQGDVHILRKGDLKDREEYSIFKNEHSAKVLLESLRLLNSVCSSAIGVSLRLAVDKIKTKRDTIKTI